MFGSVWIGAVFASVYFLYKTLATDAPLHYLLWSLGAGFIAKYLSVAVNSSQARVDYVDQLIERGYTRAEADSAWEIAINGGSNLLLRLQQEDTIVESGRN